MPNYAQITLVGHLGKDPELKYTKDGMAVATSSLAVNTKKDDPPDWYSVTAFGKNAERFAEYASKGAAVLVTGTPKIDRWKGEDNVEHTSVKVNVQVFRMLGGESKPADTKPKPDQGGDDDDLPF